MRCDNYQSFHDNISMYSLCLVKDLTCSDWIFQPFPLCFLGFLLKLLAHQLWLPVA